MAIFSDPIRAWRCDLKARPLTVLALVLILGLATLGAYRLIAQIENVRGIAPVAASYDIQVDGIEVNVKGDSGEQARLKGWKLAQRLAWEKLKGPQMSDAQIDSMVAAIVVDKELIGPRRYIATLGVIFDRAKAGQFVASDNMTSEFIGERSQPVLVIPVLQSGGVRQVFEVRGPWQRAWAEYQMAGSPIDYVRPNGGGGDSLILNAGQPGRRSRIWWRNVLDQFGAANVLIPVAQLQRQWPGGPVLGTFTARYGPDNKFLASFKLTAKDEAGLPAMLTEGVRRIDLIYRKAFADGLLKTDTTLLTDQEAFERVMAELREQLVKRDSGEAGKEAASGPQTSAAEQGDSGPEAAMESIFAVQFPTPDGAAVDIALAAVRAAPGVRSASITSLAIDGTSVMRVTSTGSLESLAASLRARGWQVSVGSNAIRISR